MKRVLFGAPFALLLLAACEPSKPAGSGTTTAPAQPAAPAQSAPSQATPTPAPTPAQPATPSGTPNADEGKKVYLTMCANCHGPDGTGAMMRAMLPKIGDLTSAEMHGRLKDEDIAALVTNGRDKMPPFGAIIKPNQLADLIAYVRTMKKAG